MAQVPERVLAWLWTVIQNYRQPALVNNDVVNVLGAYPVFKPKTATFTFESGHAALLLCLVGNLSVTFRGTAYRYPLEIWIPEEYGEPGFGAQFFVKAVGGAAIRAGQHVAHDGKIYHPYLSSWNYNPRPSSVLEFLSILHEVFAKEPPLAAVAPRPPLPAESGQPSSSRPLLPPKVISTSTEQGHQPLQSQSASGSLPLPLPPKERIGSSPAGPSRYDAPLPLPKTEMPDYPQQQHQSVVFSAASPALQLPYVALPQDRQQQPQRSSYGAAYQMHSLSQPLPQDHHHDRVNSRQHIPPAQVAMVTPQQIQSPRVPKPQTDLLTDPFDGSLPSITSPTGPAPPIPPNPEREQICMLLSDSLVNLANAKIDRNRSALAPLRAQNIALQEAHARLSAELDQVRGLDAALSNNEPILRQFVKDCDSVIASSEQVAEPNIDETLVAPTVAAQQLWNLCADEVAIREAMWCLQRAIGAGRISGADFVKLTRGLAREAFLKMALIRKISQGLGLDTGLVSQSTTT